MPLSLKIAFTAAILMFVFMQIDLSIRNSYSFYKYRVVSESVVYISAIVAFFSVLTFIWSL